MRKQKKYRIVVKHDAGSTHFLVFASSIAEAKAILMKAEGCPERAIQSVGLIPTKKQIQKTKNMLRGL